MKPLTRLDRAERHDRGLVLADQLLEACRPLDSLPSAGHRRVKRRIEASVAPRKARVTPWLRPIVIGITMLTCGATFGIAIDRLVLKRESALGREASVGAHPIRTAPRKGRKTAKPLPGETDLGESGAEDQTLAPPSPAALPASSPATLPASSPARPASAPATAANISSPSGLRGPSRKLAMREPDPVGPQASGPFLAGRPTALAPSQPAFLTEPSRPSAPPALSVMPAPAALPAQSAMVAPVVSPAPHPEVLAALTEERLMAIAVRALRSEKNVGSALVALDEYRRLFPRGRFSAEAGILRVDALTEANRRDEALSALDGLDLWRMPRGCERHVQRGELRARVGRWREARSDFDWVLAHASQQDGDLVERSLWGRARAWQQEGQHEQARKDASTYLHQFAHGRFAAEAGLLLNNTGP